MNQSSPAAFSFCGLIGFIVTSAQVSNAINDAAKLLARPEIQRAFEFIDSQLQKITDEQIHICSIPAPPFGEQKRAEYFLKRFNELGLSDVQLDDEGNCLGLREGRSIEPLLVVSAHLDTVFPEGTDVTVSRAGGKLLAPGNLGRLLWSVSTDGHCRCSSSY